MIPELIRQSMILQHLTDDLLNDLPLLILVLFFVFIQRLHVHKEVEQGVLMVRDNFMQRPGRTASLIPAWERLVVRREEGQTAVK